MSLTEKILGQQNKQSSGEDYLGWRIASIITIGMLLASAIFSIWFIYQNIYNTISNSASIIILESTPRIGAIDASALERATEKLNLKSKKTDWPNNLRNIFNYANASANTTSTTSTIYEKK